MNYSGKLFGKIGRKYIELDVGTEYVDRLKTKHIEAVEKLNKAYEIANNSIYFDDGSKHLGALAEICHKIKPHEECHGTDCIIDGVKQ